ncbi:MAG TPA: DEAD/DEAH box helicase [Candidatus Limnocylindrales bacterium]|nr:DEAD/DEAH box helicase [Candidatus Limnocylindrales bacterium]
MSFSPFALHPDLLRGVQTLGFAEATPIQQAAIPPAMAGRDVLACAMTGSGKTAAFLLPILHRILGQPRGTTRALIVTPTRELAAQIDEHRQELSKHTRLTGAAVYGGVGMEPQERAFRNGVDVLVCTPGRLLDHMQHSYAKLAGLEVLVLDEADRMLDMGFLPDVRRILQRLPARRQNLMFSATMPPPIGVLARELLTKPAVIDVERPAAPAVGVTHSVYPVAAELKSALLAALLADPSMKSVLVFTRTKHRATRVAESLSRQGHPAERIHGNRSQAQRQLALAGFKSGRVRVLVATDIAARGIDIEELSHVVNLDVPHVTDDYIHRVGRTARAGMVGDAFTLVSPDEESDLKAIERAIGRTLPRVKLPDFDYAKRPAERLEVPLAERIAAIRARKADERARARANADRRARHAGGQAPAAAPRGNVQNAGGRAPGGSAPSGRPFGGHGSGAPRRERFGR